MQGWIPINPLTNDMTLSAAEVEIPFLRAAKMGITEMVEKILITFPVAIQDLDADGKNALLLAVEYRQSEVYDMLLKMKIPESLLYQHDKEGNSAVHLAAKLPKYQNWIVPGGGLHMMWENRWYEKVKQEVPSQCSNTYNKKGETANEIFTKTHEQLAKDEREWLMRTSESCSVVAILIASVAYATASTVPGGFDQITGYPLLQNQPSFHVYSVTSVLALCFSMAALVFFVSILTSRFQQQDFRNNLPKKVLFGLICLSTSIIAILISFCTGHFFVLKHQFPKQALPTYLIACFPLICFALEKLPVYLDWIWSMMTKVPYRVHYN